MVNMCIISIFVVCLNTGDLTAAYSIPSATSSYVFRVSDSSVPQGDKRLSPSRSGVMLPPSVLLDIRKHLLMLQEKTKRIAKLRAEADALLVDIQATLRDQGFLIRSDLVGSESTHNNWSGSKMN